MNPILYCGHYPELEARFVAEVSAAREADPLSPLDVVVSGQLQRLHLRRALAREAGGHANIRFCTLSELAAEAAGPALRARGLRRLRDVLRDGLMTRAIEEAGEIGYFSRLAAREGFRGALWRTLCELRGAGLAVEDLETALARCKGSLFETLRAKLTDLTRVWRELDRLLERHGYVDSIGQLRLAAAELASGDAPVIFYGLSELCELERRFVRALVERRPQASAYLAFRDIPVCAWLKPLREFFEDLSFRERFLESRPPAPGLLGQVQRGIFKTPPLPAPAPAEDDSSLLLVSAPSREREVEKLTRDLLFSPLAALEPQRRVAVLVRDSRLYSGLLRSELGRAGVYGYFHECLTLADSAAGRAFRLLATLLDERLRRADVMEFLLTAPVLWPAALADGPATLPVAEWNQLALEAGIVAGSAAWTEGLRRLRHQLEADRARRALEDEVGQTMLNARLTALDHLARYTGYLFTRIAEVKQTTTWQERVDAFWELLLELVPRSESLQDLEAELAEAAELDAIALPLLPEHFMLFVRTALARPLQREGRFEIHEPSVLTLQEAEGVLFDEVYLPGVVEKELPHPPRQDPLLLDDERQMLNDLVLAQHGTPLPLHARERERELFAFHTALQAARRRVVLSYPRREAAASRERLPSVYLLRVAEAAAGRAMDFAALENFIVAGAHGRRVPASRMRGMPAETAATELQYDEARLAEALRTRSAAPLGYLLHGQPFFVRGAQAEQARFRDREFGIFDGWLVDSQLRERYQAGLAAPDQAVSAAQLDEYAACPFRYFIARVLESQPAEEPPELQRVAHRERGALVHRILERFYRAESDAGRVPLTADALPRLEGVARECFRNFAAENITGIPLLWQIEQERVLRWLRTFLMRELEDHSGFIPRYFDQHFSADLSDELGLRLQGTLDRIDIAPDGSARVVDYTTSRSHGHGFKLALYRLAAERQLGLRAASAVSCSLNDRAKKPLAEYTAEHWDAGRAELQSLAATLREGILAAQFFPWPSEDACGSCATRAACGTGRFTPKLRDDLEQVQPFRSATEGEQ